MNFDPTDEQRLIRDMVRRFAEQEMTPVGGGERSERADIRGSPPSCSRKVHRFSTRSITGKLGLRASDTGELIFEVYAVSDAALLGVDDLTPLGQRSLNSVSRM